MLIIAGHIRVAPERRDALVAEFEDLVRRSRAAPGCLDVAVTADSVDPGRINNFERWESQEHLDRWRAAANAPDVGDEFVAVLDSVVGWLGDLRQFRRTAFPAPGAAAGVDRRVDQDAADVGVLAAGALDARPGDVQLGQGRLDQVLGAVLLAASRAPSARR